MHQLEREVVLDCSPDTLWEFLSTPVNLNEMTPPSLHFQILSAVPDAIYNGLTLLYEIQIPLFGKRLWLTEIKHLQEGTFFVDEQRLGPYRLWYHQHRIESVENKKTRMSDLVIYQLPYGAIGAFVHRFWVKKRLEEIFDYRERRLLELFGR